MKEIHVDGIKIESKAIKYTFVWRKSIEKNKVKLKAKIRGILQQINEGIAQDNKLDNDPSIPIDRETLRARIQAINRK